MATALFIKRADLVKNTALNGSVDTDKFIQLYFGKIRGFFPKETFLSN